VLSRENAVTVAFIGLALAAFFLGSEVLNVDYGLLYALLILVGVVAPLVLNGYLDRGDTETDS
jgi:hypothetical protein